MNFNKPRITAVLGPTNTGKTHFAIDPELLSLAGCGMEDMVGILKDLGFRPAPAVVYDPDSPFAKLKELALSK